MPNLIEQLDAALATLLADWTILTTLLTLSILAFVAYPIIYHDEPDTHPLLLARQSAAAPIRNKNESPIYRSPETPYGYPLKTGLNVKAAGAAKWANGRDGDLRDVWREVMRGGSGSVGEDGKEIPRGLVMTVLGREEVVEEDLEELTRQIVVMGGAWKQAGVQKVAVYLPNSVEYLLTIFACAFYGLTPILFPYNQSHPKVFELLNSTGADALVCAAGNLPLDSLAKECPSLHLLTWVVEKTSRHMDWNGASEAAKAENVKVGVWHDIIANASSITTTTLPTNEEAPKPAPLISIWQPKDPQLKPTITTFTQSNLVAATAALISTLPLRQRLTSADLVLPADSFAHTYILCQTLAALYTHASIAITSVAGAGVDLTLASRAVSPTVVLASAETMAELHAKEVSGISSLVQKVGKYSRDQAMSAGRMPTDGLLFRLLAPSSSGASGNKPGTLRLILVAERIGYGSPALTSTMLSDLRIFTKARICYALTASSVAGAVAQTNVFDYRRVDGLGHAHFGVPVASVEVKVVGARDEEVAGTCPKGRIVVSGPGVSGGVVELGVEGRFGEDGTLGYI